MNNEYSIESANDPQHVTQLLEDRIYEYNSDETHIDDGRLFSKIIRDRDKEIIAGIAGWTWAGICEITQLWVDRKIRGRGVGKILLEAAELEARTKGCSITLVRSYSFQAPHFYEKHGYRTENIINDFPKGHRYHILTKKIG
jgi:ribosomal protein S18 acetylase RimI-like enzyme